MDNQTDTHQTQIAATCILLSVAGADEILEDRELEIIREILQEFFIINEDTGRIRFMLIEPGGYILPHHDRDIKRLHEINVAIKQPKNCIFKFFRRSNCI